MSCVSRSPDWPLTPNQSANLILLLKKGALGMENAKTIYDLGPAAANTLVIGALCDKGLAGKNVRAARKGGQRCTHYWLTAEGVRRAQSEKAKAENARTRA